MGKVSSSEGAQPRRTGVPVGRGGQDTDTQRTVGTQGRRRLQPTGHDPAPWGPGRR